MLDEDRLEHYCDSHPFAVIADSVVFGRDYRLNELPRDASGKILYRGSSELEYHAYVNWLADFLHSREIEPNERQVDLCRLVSRMNRDAAMYLLGMYAGLHEYLLLGNDALFAIYERLENPIGSYSDEDVEWIYKRAQEIKAEYEESEKSQEENGGLKVIVAVDITPPISHERIRQYLDEEAERQVLCDHVDDDFCDMAWRVPLSLVLRGVTEKSERVRLLRIFFVLYAEYASK